MFFSILFMTAVFWEEKKVHGYLISFEPPMVQSSFKDHLSKLKYRLSLGWLFESYMSASFWLLLSFFSDNYLESFRKRPKSFLIHMLQAVEKLWTTQIKPYSCKTITEYLYAIFALSSNSSNPNKSQILFGKTYARWHF